MYRISNTLLTTVDLEAQVHPTPTLVIAVNGRVFYAAPEENSSAAAFAEKLSSEMMEVELHDYAGVEKRGVLPWMLERNDEQLSTEPGDVIVYQGNQITICCDRNNGRLTRLAKIQNVTKDELLEAFGDGDLTAAFWVEWSE